MVKSDAVCIAQIFTTPLDRTTQSERMFNVTWDKGRASNLKQRDVRSAYEPTHRQPTFSLGSCSAPGVYRYPPSLEYAISWSSYGLWKWEGSNRDRDAEADPMPGLS